jgi:hypothetical protein
MERFPFGTSHTNRALFPISNGLGQRRNGGKMQHCSRKLKNKIRVCGGITRTGGVIAAASLAVVSKSNGEPVRYKYNQHIPTGTTRSYDINQDGWPDVLFDTTHPLGVHMQMLAWENDTAFKGLFIVNPWDAGNPTQGMVKGHYYGEIIDLVTPSHTVGTMNDGDVGDFFDAHPTRYAGFYFFGPDTLRHAGWAEIRITGPDEFDMYGLDVLAIGYETEPETPIIAGEPLIPVPVEKTSWGRIKALYK